MMHDDVPTGMHTLALWLERIEARQRAYEQHDPDCPVFAREQAQRGTGAYLLPAACSCWLASDPEGKQR